MAEQKRPGLYVSFVENAAAQLSGGTRGIVAIPLKTYGADATAKTFYTVSTKDAAIALFGSANISAIEWALKGGAREVLVYTLPAIDGTTVTELSAHEEAFLELETRPFHALVFDGVVSNGVQDAAKTWLIAKRTEGTHFYVVTGGTDTTDQDIAQGNARTTRLADDYVINLVSGVKDGDDTLNSSEFAPYIAGLAASTPINRAVTYAELPVDDVSKRFRKTEIESALDAGSLVFMHDGDVVRIEQGLTASKKKIRAMSSRQAVATDIRKTASTSYIGKLDNTADSRKALIAAIMAYLEILQAQNVLHNFVVEEDEANPSTADTVNLIVSYEEIDSMEKINIAVNL